MPQVGKPGQDFVALGLEGAVGVGWSLGATILWHVLAGPAGRRFAGAVVIDMTARVRNDDGWDLGLSPEACEARSAHERLVRQLIEEIEGRGETRDAAVEKLRDMSCPLCGCNLVLQLPDGAKPPGF